MLASALAEKPETVVISVDMANAFNSIHRAAMFAAVCAGSAADGAVCVRGRNAPAHRGGPGGHSVMNSSVITY